MNVNAHGGRVSGSRGNNCHEQKLKEKLLEIDHAPHAGPVGT